MDSLSKLQHTGLKPTLPRVSVLDLFLRGPQRHLVAEEVYRHLIGQGVHVGMATVYRALSQLEQAGILRKSQLGGERAVYELNDSREQHGHLVSRTDGAVHEFVDPQVEERLRSVAQAMGFELEDYVLTVFARPRLAA